MTTITASKQAELIREHILSEFVDGWDSSNPVANLRLQLKSFDYLQRWTCRRDDCGYWYEWCDISSVYDRARALVEGGCFLVYHCDVNEWLEELELISDDVTGLDDSDRWELYVHILASAIVSIVGR